MTEANEPGRYAELIAREAAHWGRSDHDPDNPQLWDDPVLRELTVEPHVRHLIDRAVAAGGPALELGCGFGDLALAIAQRGVPITGIDLSEDRVAEARALALRAGVDNVRYESGDLNVMPLPAATYRCVVAHDALHHILELDALLDRVATALVPGGVLLVSDFQGAGPVEKLVTAGTVAVLPTVQGYAAKWRARGRLRALLASEESKRDAVTGGAAADLHDASPFESVSQASIEPAIARRFEVVERYSFCPFWYHAIPKLKLPLAWKRGWIAAWRRIDEPLHRRGWTQGSYVFIAARRR